MSYNYKKQYINYNMVFDIKCPDTILSHIHSHYFNYHKYNNFENIFPI